MDTARQASCTASCSAVSVLSPRLDPSLKHSMRFVQISLGTLFFPIILDELDVDHPVKLISALRLEFLHRLQPRFSFFVEEDVHVRLRQK